jgi:glucokinase
VKELSGKSDFLWKPHPNWSEAPLFCLSTGLKQARDSQVPSLFQGTGLCWFGYLPVAKFDMMTILAGDIGGTSARLGLFEVDDAGMRPVAREVYRCREFGALEDIVARFRSRYDLAVQGATIGIAGPVVQGSVVTPNLPWHVHSRSLARAMGVTRVELINDLVANAYGAAALSPKDFEVLQTGQPDPEGHACILSAGTGLGQAGFFFDGSVRRPMPSEGGHADFAPQNDLEIELLRFLQGRFGHVSYERVLSGPGLVNIFEFLTHTGRGESSESLDRELSQASGGAAGAISRAAQSGTSSRASLALDQFVAIYGAAAGNLALTFKATGGVYIGGGIAPQILPRLRGELFLKAFLDKGRMRPLLEAVTIQVILNDECALLGSALHAALALGGMSHSWVR